MKKTMLSGLAFVLSLGVQGHAGAAPYLAPLRQAAPDQESPLPSRSTLESSLSRSIGRKVSVSVRDDLAEPLRSSGSGGPDVLITPAPMAASALALGHELVGSTAPAERFFLVGAPQIESMSSLKGLRLYLPQQDSVHAYMARGMLNAHGVSLQDLGKVEYARYPQAGLTAVALRMFDVTVVRESEWTAWFAGHPGAAKVLATSIPVPGGLSVLVKGGLPAGVRARISKWFKKHAAEAGFKPVILRADPSDYRAVAQLGVSTPTQLPGARVVTAQDVKGLLDQGALLVDTRTESEFNAKHMPRAVLASYGEKSIKDVAFQAAQDDFSALDRLDKSARIIFSCTGAECWKAYKASRLALERGFKAVHWFRGGLSEWESAGQAVVVRN